VRVRAGDELINPRYRKFARFPGTSISPIKSRRLAMDEARIMVRREKAAARNGSIHYSVAVVLMRSRVVVENRHAANAIPRWLARSLSLIPA